MVPSQERAGLLLRAPLPDGPGTARADRFSAPGTHPAEPVEQFV